MRLDRLDCAALVLQALLLVAFVASHEVARTAATGRGLL